MASATLLLLSISSGCLAQTTDISQTELIRRINSSHNGLILDVRSPEEYLDGHVPGAFNIPFDRLDARLPEIDSYRN